MESGVQLGLGEGPNKKVGPMSRPRGTIDTASRTLTYTYAIMRFLGQLYSKAAKGVSRQKIGVRPHPHEPKTITFWDKLAHFSGKTSPEKLAG